VLAAERLLASSDVDASADSTEDAVPRGGVMDQLLLQAAAAARRRGNLALTARLLQQCRDAAAPNSTSAVRVLLATHIEQAKLAWAESQLPAGRLEAAKLLGDSLCSADGAAVAETTSGQLKARAWLLLHSWLSELHAARHEHDDLFGMLPADTFCPAHRLNGRLDRLAVLDQLQLSDAQRDMAVCLRSAVAEDEHSAEAWRALGVWLSAITAAAAGTESAGLAVTEGAERVRVQARGAALFAFCQSLRSAGLSQVQPLTKSRACCVPCASWWTARSPYLHSHEQLTTKQRLLFSRGKANTLLNFLRAVWQGVISAPQGQTLQLLRVLELVQELSGADSDADVGLATLSDIPAALWQVRRLESALTLAAPEVTGC
jgi:hypothetical protein